MKVFVTGGTGLVGSHTVERLASAGHPVRAMVRSEASRRMVESLGATAVEGSVERQADWTSARGCDLIVHAAAIVTSPDTWQRYYDINVEGTRHAVHAAADCGARLIHISSIAVYGRRPDEGDAGAVDEDFPFGPIDAYDYYARSKREAEAVLWEEGTRLGVSSVALRPCVIYGERERLFMLRILNALRWGVAPVIGNGENTLAMVYVGNVVDAIERAAERRDITGAFNTANDGGFTQRELYGIIRAVAGRRIRMITIPLPLAVAAGTLWQSLHRLVRPGLYTGVGRSSGHFLARDNPFTSEKARRVLGWEPQSDPHESLRQTVHWFLERHPELGP